VTRQPRAPQGDQGRLARRGDAPADDGSTSTRRDGRNTQPENRDRRGVGRTSPERAERRPTADRGGDRHHHDGKGGHSHSKDRHRHYYYPIGYSVSWLPLGYRVVYVRERPYYYYGGLFFRLSDSIYVVTTAPIGAVVSILPPAYSVAYVGERPYYFANDTYYVWDGGRAGYVVVPEPSFSDQQLAVNSELFAYPKEGQSEERQTQDRYECVGWASVKSGFDPSYPYHPPRPQARSDFDRAMTACLEAHGYTVR
jgi:hypothetical protein